MQGAAVNLGIASISPPCVVISLLSSPSPRSSISLPAQAAASTRSHEPLARARQRVRTRTMRAVATPTASEATRRARVGEQAGEEAAAAPARLSHRTTAMMEPWSTEPPPPPAPQGTSPPPLPSLPRRWTDGGQSRGRTCFRLSVCLVAT